MSHRPPTSCQVLLGVTLCYFLVSWLVVSKLILPVRSLPDIHSPFGPFYWGEMFAAIIVPITGTVANLLMLTVRAAFGIVIGWIAVVWMLCGTVFTGFLLYGNNVTTMFQPNELIFAWIGIVLRIGILMLYIVALRQFQSWRTYPYD